MKIEMNMKLKISSYYGDLKTIKINEEGELVFIVMEEKRIDDRYSYSGYRTELVEREVDFGDLLFEIEGTGE